MKPEDNQPVTINNNPRGGWTASTVEEALAALFCIAACCAWNAGFKFVAVILTAKCAIDVVCALKAAWNEIAAEAMEKANKNQEEEKAKAAFVNN